MSDTQEDFLDSREFYELSQAYRHSDMGIPEWNYLTGYIRKNISDLLIDAERYRTVRELAMLGNFALLRGAINQYGNDAFDTAIDKARGAK